MRNTWLCLRVWRLLVPCIVLASIGISGCSKMVSGAKHLERGKQFFQIKDYQRAAVELHAASQADPKNPEPYYQLALAYLAMGQLQNGVTYALKATEVDPKYGPAQAKVAELMTQYSNNDPQLLKEAEQRATAALAASPQDPDAKNALAAAEAGLGEPEKAIKRLEETLLSVPGDLKTAINLARAKMAKHDTDGAVEILKIAAAQSPKSAEHALALGQLYMQIKRPAQAEAEFRRVLEIDPKRALALALIGQMQLDRGQVDLAEATFQQLSALPDKEYRPTHAIFQFQHGRRLEAIREFEQLNKADPTDRRLRSFLVSAYVSTNRRAEAEKVLDAALEKNQKDVDALLQRGALYSALGKDTEAQRDLTQLQAIQGDSAQAHYLLAHFYERRGQPLQQRQELSDALKYNPAFLPARIELAGVLIAEKAARAALELLDAASADQKKTVEVIVQRNWALYSLGDLSELRKGIDHGLSVARAPDLLLQDAMLKFKQKDYARAKAALEEVLRNNPEEVRAVQILATTYMAQKQPAMALEKAREYASRRPQSAPLQLYFGQLAQNAGNLAEARRAYDAAKAASPNLEGADLALALLDLWEHKLDDARKRLTALLSAHNNTTAGYLLGQVEEAAGNFPAAIDAYQKTVDAEPNNVAALNNLAYALVQYGNQADEALRYAQKAEELSPDTPLVEGTLGWVLYRKGMYKIAVPYLERAAHKKGEAVDHYHLAMAYFQTGNRQRGLQTLQTALQMDPSLPEAKMAQQFLK